MIVLIYNKFHSILLVIILHYLYNGFLIKFYFILFYRFEFNLRSALGYTLNTCTEVPSCL